MTTGTISIGGSSQAGTSAIALGTSTQTYSINIGSNAPADTKTQTINIGNSALSSANNNGIGINIGSGQLNGGVNGSSVSVNIASGNLIGTNGDNETVNIATGTLATLASDVVNIGTGGTTSGVDKITIGSVGAAAHTLLLQGGNGATAIQLTQASGGTITIGSTSGASAVIIQSGTGDITLKGHLLSSQATAPTIGTPANCGTSPTAAVTTGSTDSAGSFTITAGTGSPTTCDTVVTFNATYTSAPKSVVITPTLAVGSATNQREAYISAVSATTFTVKINTNLTGNTPAPSEVMSFYYWVVK